LSIDLDLSDAVYAKATLSVQLGNEMPFSYSGVLASVRLVRASENAALFQARLVPQLWQLTLTKHSRIWTKKSVTDVIKELLDEAGVEHEFRPMPNFPTEEHICQYKESDLAFIHRWLEREGMYYFFEQTDDGDVMIITNDKSSHTSLRQSPVRYWPQNDGVQDSVVQQAFDNFAATHNALPARVKLIDYDYARPLLDVSSAVAVEANATGEIAEYGGRFFSPEDRPAPRQHPRRRAARQEEDVLLDRRGRRSCPPATSSPSSSTRCCNTTSSTCACTSSTTGTTRRWVRRGARSSSVSTKRSTRSRSTRSPPRPNTATAS
jgi:uncharacterized protein involved in type VI secretion and phage assembly